MSAGGSAGLGGSGQVNVAQAQAAAAAQDAQEVVSSQEASEMSMVKGAEDVSNPAASSRIRKKEESFKTLSARRSSKTSESKEKKTEEAGEKSQDLAEKFTHDDPELSSQDLRDLAKGIDDETSAEDIQKQVEGKFPDPLQQQAALNYLLQSTPPGPKRDNIIRALQNHALQNARALKGGVNVKLASVQTAQALGIPATQLRALYNQITNTEDNAESLETVLSSYSPEELPVVTRFLVTGMTAELKSEASSIEAPKLQILLGKLLDFQALSSIKASLQRDGEALAARAKAEGTSLPPSFSILQLVKAFFLLIAEKFVTATKVIKTVDLVISVPDINLKSEVLGIFYKNVKESSPRIITSAEKRQNLASTVLNALDTINADNEDYPKNTDFPKPNPYPSSSLQGVNFAGGSIQASNDTAPAA